MRIGYKCRRQKLPRYSEYTPFNVSKEINLLLRKKILIRGPKVGQSYSFRLNPYYAWRGNGKKGREWVGQIIQGGKQD